ncbi:MAG: trypsin-like peptidase domain-containing protein [Candidatus Sungiibacteriota bacterium]|uniref:Trypsin-like peptidase domain-containing protein n=1 Tax=Candidatus Sungiibacteriota bacterium TaxID=2750080 RepID=A0A7T5RKG1_9BACT|nr:MAG: trypsin-like peptidase domain-containing protein [Candidatus Sungbacteria bacterium]
MPGGEPFFFNRPQKILEKITEKISNNTEIQEKILRQDELVVRVVEESSPAVVSVVASKDVPVVEQFFIDPFGDDPFFRQFFGDGSGFSIPQFRQKGTKREEVSSGTGFIVSSDGFIVTNKHVVADKDADYTALMNDGRKVPAKVLARDPLQDLAVLKIDGTDHPLLKFGDSSRVKIGQSVIAIGNALGEFRNTVSVGIVSGLQRSVVASGAPTGPEMLQELIQTDAAINPGNSGGPLLNLRGEVIGINTAVARGAENIGFAIPVNKVKRALENVRTHGKIIYPFLGVRYIAVTKTLAEKEKLGRDYGALLKGSETEYAVIPGSPAGRAGLRAGDIILELNGERIDQEQTLASLIQKYQVGAEITLKVFREGKEFEVKIKLEERK